MKGIKEKLLTIAIAIILTMFIFYGINTFYPRPEWDDICKDIIGITTKEACESSGGEWSPIEKRAREPRAVQIENDEYTCIKVDEDKTGEIVFNCRKAEWDTEIENGYCECSVYEYAREIYSRNVFIIALILGLIAVLLGSIYLKVPSVAVGVMAGGILTIIVGTIGYWGDMPDFARFICLGIVLAILVTIAYKKLKK